MSEAAIRDRLEINSDELDLLFQIEGAREQPWTSDSMAAVAAAATHANRAVPPETMLSETVQPSPYGPVVVLDVIGTEEENAAWLSAFAGHLSAAGWSGTLTPVPDPPSSYLPDGFLDAFGTTLFAALPITPSRSPRSTSGWVAPQWGVDSATTNELCRRLTDWGAASGGDIHLRTGRIQVHFTGPEVADHLAWALKHDYSAGVSLIDAAGQTLRRVSFGRMGTVISQVVDDRPDWQERVNALRQPLQVLGNRVEVAFVRTTQTLVTSWINLNNVAPALPFVNEAKVRNNRELWGRYLPDVHGIQVVTSAHMTGISDVSAWTVENLGEDRYLVEARDLEPWFAGTEPNPEVLAAARADFAGALLTPEAINRPAGGIPRP